MLDKTSALVQLRDLGSIKISGVRRHFILCRCSCGKEFNARLDYLKVGSVQSCGCLRTKKRPDRPAYNAKPPGVAAARQVFLSYKGRAKTKNVPFELSFDEFVDICSKNCFYCDGAPSSEFKSWYVRGMRVGTRKVNGSFKYNGIDRVEPALGYVPGNSRPCCTYCNFAKGANTEKEFREWAERFAQHLPNWQCTRS